MKILTSLLLSAALAVAAVPTPDSHFGHSMKADRSPLAWAKIVAYFDALPPASDRIRVERMGRSTEGREMILAIISSPENLKKLERYKAIQAALADPRKTRPAEAEKLIAEGKSIVAITCTIHANEPAANATAVQFTYDLLTQDKPKFRAILENTIFLLVPSLNPDGVDIISNWARKTMGTPHEGTLPPELYQKYVGHDNNRDWYIFSQAETRATIEKLHHVWKPQIIYDVHQMGAATARMFVPPWMDPIDPNVDPVIAQGANAIGMGMALDLTSAGRKGVVVNAVYDFWTPARHYQAYHGGMRILTESASARLFSPITMRPEQLRGQSQGYNVGERAWNHLEPWTGGTWTIGEIVTDQLIAFESVLWQASVRREELLRNFYGVHQRAVARTAPYSFIVPAEQMDPGGTRKMLETLAFGQVEIEQAREKFTADGKEYPAGSFVIRMQQPYSAFAKTLLERQQYPDLRLYPGGPPKRPYDVTAQTLPLLMGAEVVTVKDAFTAALAPAKSLEPKQKGPVAPDRLAGANVDTWKQVNQLWRSGATLWRDPRTGDWSRTQFPGAVAKKKPRLALYRSWIPQMDEGWTRFVLEQFGFEYTRLTNPMVLEGNLRAKFDVIVVPDQSPGSIVNGFAANAMPTEFTGGVGTAGAAALKSFAEQGGTLVFVNHSTEFASEQLGAASKNVLRGISSRDFYSPGSLLKVSLDASHPLTLGLPKDLTIWMEQSPAWEVASTEKAVATYPAGEILASGWLLGEKYLANKAAIVEVPMGQGRAILFGMRPQYRAQSYQTFKLFFNAFVL